MAEYTPLLTWDDDGERFYETGVDHGVLFPKNGSAYEDGVAWSGLTAFNDNPEGADSNEIYADNILYLNLTSTEKFNFGIEAYQYPEEFAECDGSKAAVSGVYFGQQTRKAFGFAVRTRIGNDEDGSDHGYKIHLCYGCKAAVASKDYQTINDSPEAATMSWDCSTTPIQVTGYKPVSHIVIDSRKFTETAAAAKLVAFEKILYGTPATTGTSATEEVPARLPLPDEVITLLTVA